MDKNKLDFLNSIILSTRSKYSRGEKDEKTFTEGGIAVDRRAISYTYKIKQESSVFNQADIYSFTIQISKIKGYYWFKDDRNRYITKIEINTSRSTGYSTKLVDTIWYDSDIDDSFKIQSKLFNLVEELDNDLEDKIKNSKINTYLNEINKLVDKDVARDEKLDSILP